MSDENRKKMRWVPLEANPELFNDYTSQLGLDTSRASFVSSIDCKESVQFVLTMLETDVYGFDEEMLSFVPQPVLATVLLFPVTEATEAQRREQAAQKAELPDLIYCRQTIGNACGTIGLLHAIANSPASLKPDSALVSIVAKCKGKSPEESAQVLENEPALEQAHSTAAAGGQTSAPAADSRVELHFCAFVDHKGRLVELDGRKAGPVDHGPIRQDLLRDSIRLTRDFMQLAPDSHEFSLIALVGQGPL